MGARSGLIEDVQEVPELAPMRNRPRSARRQGRLRQSWGLILLALVAACGGEAPVELGPRRPGVLITLDTTNAGVLDIYGDDLGLTPNLTELSRSSVVFDRAHTVAPITLPAHTSMLTGLYPLRHGVRENGMMSLSGEAETLAELAREAGFETAAFISASVLLAHYGLDQGFEVYDEPKDKKGRPAMRTGERSSALVTDAALQWLEERDDDRPFLLWVHYFDPHKPYTPPAEFLEKAGGDPYRAEVTAMDHDLGRLIDALDRRYGLDELMLAVVADHGEGFDAHDEETHSLLCYETTVHVPFLLRYPDGRRAGTRSDELVSVVDVFPTFLRQLGLRPSPEVDGVDLSDSPVPADRGVYVESYSGYLTYGWSPLAAWIDGTGKYLHSSEPEFYDLDEDPGELRNLLSSGEADPEPHRRAIAALARLPRLESGEQVELDSAQIAELNALGYAAAGLEARELPDPLDDSSLPAPASRTEVHAKSNHALGLLAHGRNAEAIPLLREVIAENPRDINALEGLGSALVHVGRFREAIEPLEALLATGNDRHLARICLGVSYEEIGDYEKSLLHFKGARAIHAGGPGTAAAIQRNEKRLRRE